MAVTIKTNHQWRALVYRHDVPAKVLASQFDWTNEDDHSDGFFCYRGYWYHVANFVHLEHAADLQEWDAYHGDSYFSGVVIKLSRDGERVMVGTYYTLI